MDTRMKGWKTWFLFYGLSDSNRRPDDTGCLRRHDEDFIADTFYQGCVGLERFLHDVKVPGHDFSCRSISMCLGEGGVPCEVGNEDSLISLFGIGHSNNPQ